MRISVIIPVYNAEKYLPQALDSVLAQTYSDFECVCVNDGSVDGSGDILAEYEERFQQQGRILRIVNKTNGGVSSARNAGLDAARGDYITWLDSDDVLAPSRFEVAARIVEKEHPDLVRLYYQMSVYVPDDFTNKSDYAYETLTDPAQIFHWGWGELNANGMSWLWFAKRELLAGRRFRLGMAVKEDCIFSSSLIPKIKKLCVSQDKGLLYRQVPTSLMHSVRKAQDCVNCQVAFFDLWHEQKAYAESVGELEFLSYRLRRCSQNDFLDWVRMRPKDEAPDMPKRVREAYLKMARSGAYSKRWAINYRYRAVLPLYELTGWLWPIMLVESLVRLYRLMMPKRRRGRAVNLI